MKIIICLISCFAMLNCTKFNGDIPKEYRQPFSHYKSNQIIYFKSNLNDYDTLKIENFDSLILKSNGMYNMPSKTLFLKASYGLENFTKKNKFLYDILLRKSSGRYDSIGNLNFISLCKVKNNSNDVDDNISINIEYRNFTGILDVKKPIDTIDNHFSGKTVYGKNFDSYGADWVKKIYWSDKEGLIGYEKEDGQIYTVLKKE